jgi:hypothetical protein
MSKVFTSIKAGLVEAIAHAKGDAAVRVYRPQAVDVKGLRQRVSPPATGPAQRDRKRPRRSSAGYGGVSDDK